jgi:predicted nucleic acid-binding protein
MLLVSRAMSCMNAVDTNVLIYAQDPRDRRKQQIAGSLLDSLTDAVLLWQVACEYIAASKKLAPFGFSYEKAWSDLGRLRSSWQGQLPDWGIHDRAERVLRNTGCSFWVAMLLSGCISAGIQQLYSEDFGDLDAVGGVRIINPFQES